MSFLEDRVCSTALASSRVLLTSTDLGASVPIVVQEVWVMQKSHQSNKSRARVRYEYFYKNLIDLIDIARSDLLNRKIFGFV